MSSVAVTIIRLLSRDLINSDKKLSSLSLIHNKLEEDSFTWHEDDDEKPALCVVIFELLDLTMINLKLISNTKRSEKKLSR